MTLLPEVRIDWKDYFGATSSTVHRLRAGATNANILTFVTAMSAVSSAGVVRYTIFHPIAMSATIAGAGAYQSSIDKAKLTYLGGQAQSLTMLVPAPLATDFLVTDKLTVDTSAAAVAAVNAAAISKLVDAGGNAIAGYESGIRTRGKGKRLSR